MIHEDDTYLDCQVDHVISEKHGGLTESENLAYAGTFCNRAKGTDIGSIAANSSDFTRFFDPRKDRWADHFALNGAEIRTRTPIGEVTATILGFNDVERILERDTLIQVERYPTKEAAELTAEGEA